MKRICFWFMLIVALIMHSSSAFSNPCPPWEAEVLDIPAIIQQRSQWCWAACVLMVLNFDDQHSSDCVDFPVVSQCAVAEVAQKLDTDYFGDELCCNENYYACNLPMENSHDVSNLFNDGFSRDYRTRLRGYLDYDDIKENINEGRPIIGRWGNEDYGHFFIIKGYLEIIEPITYSWLRRTFCRSLKLVFINDPIKGAKFIVFDHLISGWTYADDYGFTLTHWIELRMW